MSSETHFLDTMKHSKFNIHDHIPPFEEAHPCDRPNCTNIGAKDFVGEWLCNQCIHDDVFNDMSERED